MNQLDKNIKEKLTNRAFTPSASAWERLEVKLNGNPEQKKKKGWLFFAGIAASIAILLSLSISFFNNKNQVIQPKEIIVENAIDTLNIKQNINKMFDGIKDEEAVVNNEFIEEKPLKEKLKSNSIITKEKKVKKSNFREVTNPETPKNTNLSKISDKEIKKIESIDFSKQQQDKAIKKKTNNSIKVNSDDLLYAVTHSQTEVDAYYAKHQISREDVLKTIKSELEKSDININPETILAEVERSIGDEDFQNNFMKSLKKKVSDIATAFASRNN